MLGSPNPYESPAQLPDEAESDFPAAKELEEINGFVSARTWGLLACIGLGTNLALTALLLAVLVGQLIFLDFFEDVQLRSWLEPLYSACFAAMNGSRFATAIPFLVWEYRAYRNLTSLGHRRLESKYVWVVICWFVPILNWICPYQVMRELFRRSHPHADDDESQRPAAASVKIWWGAWLIAAAIGIWIRYFGQSPQTIFEEYIAYAAEIAYKVAAITSAAVAIHLVSGIDSFQLQRIKRLHADCE